MPLIYTFKKGSDDAVNINSTYGVIVDKSTGLIGKPSLKNVDSFDWKYLHGTTPDLFNRRYQNKEITLSCWMTADSKQQLVERFNNFISYFSYDGLIFMKVTWPTDNNNGYVVPNPHTAKGLFGLVWLSKVDGVDFKWRYGKQVIRFKLILVDPYPMKQILRVTGEEGDGVDYDIVSDTEIDIFTSNGLEVYDILTGSGHLATGINTYILVCGDIVHATNSSSQDTLIKPSNHLDTVTVIYEEI